VSCRSNRRRLRRGSTAGRSRLGRRGAPAAPGASPTRCPSSGGPSSNCSGAPRRSPPSTATRVDGRHRNRPGSASPSTSSSASSSPWCCARRVLERDARAIRHRRLPLEVTSGAGAPPSLVHEFLRALPSRSPGTAPALAVIFADLAGPLPMQPPPAGDVGSGKTVVAVAALLAAVQGGHQGATDWCRPRSWPNSTSSRPGAHRVRSWSRTPDGWRARRCARCC